MAEICKLCGAEMPDEAAFCPQCGGPKPPVQQKKKVKWWMIVVPVLLVIVLAAALLWKPVYMHLMPEAALAKAAVNTVEELKARNEGSPFLVLAGAYDETQQNTVEMKLNYWDEYTGDVTLGMTAQYDRLAKQSQLEMAMAMYGQSFDIGMYVDDEVLAMNMSQLTGENYFGIVYETFSQDIRGNSLVFDALGEETVEVLEEYVDLIHSSMSQETAEFSPSERYGEILIGFCGELEPTVASEKRAGRDYEKRLHRFLFRYRCPAGAAAG